MQRTIRFVFLAALAATAQFALALEVINTVAGNGANTNSGDGGSAVGATIAHLDPSSIATDSNGDIYFCDVTFSRVRKIDKTTGTLTTVAGTGASGYSGDGGDPKLAKLNHPVSLCFDTNNHLYIVDQGNHRVRKIASGVIDTIAGDGFTGDCAQGRYNGDGIDAKTASLNFPNSIALDEANNALYIGDADNFRIRRVDLGTGLISTAAGDGTQGPNGDGGLATMSQFVQINGLAVNPLNNYVYITDGNRIREINIDTSNINNFAGTASPGYAGDNMSFSNAVFFNPHGLAFDSAGNLYVSDTDNQRVRKIDIYNIFTVAGNGTQGSGGDTLAATSAELNNPNGVAVDSGGNLYITQEGDNRIRRVDAAGGTITTAAGGGEGAFSGDGGAATSASFSFVEGVALDNAGNIYLSDAGNHRIRKISGGTVTTIAGDGTANTSGDGGPATSAQMHTPQGLVVDIDGNIYFADEDGQRVRKITASTGIITTFAGDGNGGHGGDLGLATSAQLDEPKDVALAKNRDLYICELGQGYVRKVNASGFITTVAGNGTHGPINDGGDAKSASLCEPHSIAVNPVDDTLYIADTYNYRIRKVDGAGIISTVAGNGTIGSSGDGGPATSASLGIVSCIRFDAAGNLYILDSSNNKVRKVDAAGTISTWAGTGALGFSGDGGDALSAAMSFPIAAGFGPGGLFVSDIGNNRIRRIHTNTPPVIKSINLSQNPVKTGVPLNLNADVADPDGDTLLFHWSFSDGFSGGTGNPFSHTFDTGGDLTGTLMVYDGYESTSVDFPLQVLAPSSGGAGVSNVSTGKDPVANPLNGITIKVSSSDGGIVELTVDIEALNKAAFQASTDFTDVPGRSSSGVKGSKPVHKFVETGVFVATTHGIEVDTDTEKGKARKTIAISRKETGQDARVTSEPANRDITTKSIKGKFGFLSSAKKADSVTYSGRVSLPAGMDLSKVQEFSVGVGNITDSTTVDPKGKGTIPGLEGHIKKLKVKYPKLKGTTITVGGEPAQIDVTFEMNGMSAAGFDTEGVTAAATDFNFKKVAARSIQVAMVLAGVSYEISAKADFKLSPKKDAGSLITSRVGR
jgi:sugar lactone lactonase YvrE